MLIDRSAAVAFLLLGSACAAQTGTPQTADVAAFCETNPCRWTDNGPEPFVVDDQISIKRGETLPLAATESGGKLTGFRVLGPDDPTTPVITLEFETDPNDIALHIDSTFDQYLKFHILMRFHGEDDWYETTSCSLMPHASNIELWNDPIEELRVFGFRVVEEGSEEANICQN